MLWGRGSQFLQKTESEWQLKKIVNEGGIGRKMESTLTCLVQPTVSSSSPSWRLKPSRWSSWQRFTHVLSWVLRFVNNCRNTVENREYGPLKPEEVKEAQLYTIRDAQKKSFKEYEVIKNGKLLSTKSKLLKLMPKIDEDGILRCDGRLCYAEFLPYEVRFPVIRYHGVIG